jgi:drug/metabolite transporter (DMT)-like permease
MSWLSSTKWIGTAAGVCGAILIALNLGVVAYGFALFLVSSVLWGAVALVQRELSLIVLQSVFTVVNVMGLWRWAA